MGSKLRKSSWILLTLLGALTLITSLASVNIAYFQKDDLIGGPEDINLSELAADRIDVLHRVRGHLQSAVSYAGEGSLEATRKKLLPDPLKHLIPLSEASRRESYER
jgi:hypothetical protein